MEIFNPSIPRAILWTEKTTMDEFFELDPVNEYFFEYYTSLREEPFAVPMDAVNVFNEVYYQATRLVYEVSCSPHYILLQSYFHDIKANLGWNNCAEMVMSMVYWILEAAEPAVSLIAFHTKNELKTLCMNCIYWLPFSKCSKELLDNHLLMKYDFKPKPVSPDILWSKYILWPDFTGNYNRDMLNSLIHFWDDNEDRRKVAKMIKDSIKRDADFRKHIADAEEVIYLLDDYIDYGTGLMCAEPDPIEVYNKLKERVRQLEYENGAKQSRIYELENSIERLKALNKKVNADGRDRLYTQGQIVDYCKERAELRQVESIVYMLYRFLRQVGTESDYEIVDEIEEDFKNRITAPTHVEHQTVIPKVEHYYDKVDKVENKFPSLQPMDDPTKMIE